MSQRKTPDEIVRWSYGSESVLEASGIVAFTKTTSERPANRYGDSVIIRMRDPLQEMVVMRRSGLTGVFWPVAGISG